MDASYDKHDGIELRALGSEVEMEREREVERAEEEEVLVSYGGAGEEPTAQMVAPEADELVPPRLGIEYLPHQIEGVRWMMAREAADAPICRGGVLGDDMGLGKTFQTIGLLKNGDAGVRTLIVCPPALMAGWTEELRACGYEVAVLVGPIVWSVYPDGCGEGRGGENTVWLTTYPKACTYHRLRIGSRTGRNKYFWDRIVLDEGHAIRNGKDCARWTASLAFSKFAERRWILSATPVQNGPRDWENLCMFLRTRCPRSELTRIGETLMLRRTMAELRAAITELPPAPRFITHDLNIPAGGQEESVFRALCDQLQTVIEGNTVSALIKLELYMRIQQFLVHPQIYIEAMRAKFKRAYPRPDWRGTATKWDAFHEQLEIAVADRVPTIVFCNFRSEMDRVAAAATALGARVWSVRGGMGSDAVGAAVNEARSTTEIGTEAVGTSSGADTSDSPRRPREAVVFVVQIVAGGAGLNLQFCRRILFLSQHWNPAVVHQAVGRAVRIRQKAVVDIHMFRVVDRVMDNLDRRVVEVHSRKITAAKEVCLSLYEGYAPLAVDSFYDPDNEMEPATNETLADDDEDPE